MTEVDALREALKPQLQAVPTGRTDVPGISASKAKQGLKLPSRARELLGASSVGDEDRSARLFELAALLREAGASEDSTFVLIRQSCWNKFAGRDDEIERLWEAVERSRGDGSGPTELAASFRRSKVPENVDSFLDRYIEPPTWLVRGILQKEGLHFIAAPKKCYKSTFVTDLAFSLTAGTKFLNGIPVDQQASVLMIQEENPEGLQQQRLRAMRNAKGAFPEAPRENGEGYICDFSQAPFWQWNRSGLKLVYEEDRQEIENWVRRKNVEVLILDPLYILAGCEILHGKDILQILEWWLHLKHDLGVTVVIVHHMKKLPEDTPQDLGQLIFGSSYLANAYDGAVLLMPQYVPGTMMIEKVHAVRDYRAWQEPSFDFSIYLEEDGSEYRVQLDEGRRREHPLVHLVRKHPGITRREAAKALGIDPTKVSEAAKRHGLRIEKVEKRGGGRRQIAFFPQVS